MSFRITPVSKKTATTPKYLKESEVSEITGLSVFTLRNHRHLRKGIPYCKVGKSVRYLESDVLGFMEDNKIHPEN